ncbi:nucleoside hydrolase-like domain-containing protein [Falsiroseomonas sp. HC035]|uniref:nucleoside hydrolase-like domain-containing protein n=1 Tax=Falsiroseomonas sp. HC035 TaxID=3390999 RepID=UPI003D311E9D
MSNPRVFVTTDIGGFDKDDDQSMVHLLIYADKLDIVGLGSAAPGPGRAADIHQVIDVYAKDFANLSTHSADYPTPDALRAVVHQGATSMAPAGGIASPTDASKAIIAAARAGSASDPLYVLTWGAVGDVAQALHDAPDIANKIRLISIGRDQQDPNAGQYLMDNWKGKVWWIDNQDSFRGLFVPENGSNTPIAGWPEANLSGHGALGDYFVAQSRDLYGDRDGASSVNGLKMGDAPTTLYLIDGANNNDPTADSWGGDFVQQGPNYWTDNPAPSLAMGPYAGARTVAEDRQAFLSDFVARMDRAQAPANGPAPTPSQPSQPEPARPEPSEPAPPSTGATIGLGTTELDRLALSGFSVEQHGKPSGGAWLATRGEGTATGTFAGADGTYAVSVSYLDEFDGQSPMSISVNGQVVKSWVASVDDEQIKSQSVNVALKSGDSISVAGTSDWGEYVRFDTITVSATGNAPAPTPSQPSQPEPARPEPSEPAPPSTGATIGLGTTELDRLALSGFSVEQHGKPSGGAWLATRGEGTATGTFAGADGTYAVSVSYLDEFDGQSPMSISVNGQVVKSWVASVDDEQIKSQSVNVALKSGDSISVAGTSDGGEYVRMDTIKIGAAGSAPEPSPTPAPTPTPTPPPVAEAPLARADYDLFAFAGQSNAAGHFYTRPGDPTGGPLGNDVFEAALSKAMGGGPVTAVNVAVSGSGSNQYADANLYWWDINGDRPSKLLVDAVAKLKAAESGGRQLDGLIWAQGEDDARQAHGSQKAAVVNRMVESTESVFAYIRDQLDDPDLPIFIQQLGNFPNDTPADRYEAIRGGHAQIIAEDPYTYMGATTTDLNQHHPDNVHYSNAEYGVIANRLADGVSDVLIG